MLGDTHGHMNNMEPIVIAPDKLSTLIDTLAQAVNLLYQSVKSRMEKQMLLEVKDERQEYGKSH